MPRPPRRKRRLKKREEQAGDVEAAPPRRQRQSGERPLAPLPGLPGFVERRRGPGLVRPDRAFGKRERDDERSRNGDQRRQSGEPERAARGDGGGEAVDRLRG